MPLLAREIQHIKTDRQALINSGVEPEHVYQVLTLIELQRIRSGIENQEVLLESIFEVTRKIEDSLPIYR
ncbi:hypothetical protein ACWWJF_17135 [Symbiopectobacterium sp. Eva_TO]